MKEMIFNMNNSGKIENSNKFLPSISWKLRIIAYNLIL